MPNFSGKNLSATSRRI
jgi:hypothetical protein